MRNKTTENARRCDMKIVQLPAGDTWQARQLVRNGECSIRPTCSPPDVPFFVPPGGTFLGFLGYKKRGVRTPKNSSARPVSVWEREFDSQPRRAKRNASATVDMSLRQGFNLSLSSSRLVGLAAGRATVTVRCFAGPNGGQET